jgi:hypothetical protein
MVVVNAIEVDGIKKPETLPHTNFGNFSDGEKFYFFENEDEANTLKALMTYNEEIFFNFETQKFEVR